MKATVDNKKPVKNDLLLLSYQACDDNPPAALFWEVLVYPAFWFLKVYGQDGMYSEYKVVS